jgi:predicted GIY-YIG superfamily endonuclease
MTICALTRAFGLRALPLLQNLTDTIPYWQRGSRLAETALHREKQIKEWKRDWKINLIERENRHRVDLFPTLTI